MKTVEEILAEAHALGVTDEQLAEQAMPPIGVLVAQMLAGRSLTSPKCYRGTGFEVHVQPSCRCKAGR
jgi:hypothetical protein